MFINKIDIHNYIFYSPLKIKKDYVVQLCGVQTTIPIFITLISINNDTIMRQLGCMFSLTPINDFPLKMFVADIYRFPRILCYLFQS